MPFLELRISRSFPIKNTGIGVEIASKLAWFYIYPNLVSAQTLGYYQEIKKFDVVSTRENFDYQVGRIYAFIQELGSTNHPEENAAGLVKFIASLIETFGFEGKGNSYRITNERDGMTNALLNWRLCFEASDGRVVMILIPGTAKQ